MKKVRIVVLQKKAAYYLCSIIIVFLLLSVSLWIYLSSLPAGTFTDPNSRIIVVDPGHGGIDGGTKRALNAMEVNGAKRTVHDPVQEKYYLLVYSKIPGVIVETAFISNDTERQLLTRDEFREQLANAIANGVEHYLKESGETKNAKQSK